MRQLAYASEGIKWTSQFKIINMEILDFPRMMEIKTPNTLDPSPGKVRRLFCGVLPPQMV